MNLGILLTKFRKDKNVIAAYLFGSQVKGRAQKDSDYDIALLCEKKPNNEWNYIKKFTRLFVNKSLDIKILNESDISFQFDVIKTGRRLYCSNRRKRIEYEVHLLSEYFDFKHYLDYYDRCMYKHIIDGSHGHRL